MSYRIEYDAVGGIKDGKNTKQKGIFAVCLVAGLVTGAVLIKTVGLSWVQEVLMPGDPVVTAAALEGMLEDLKCGSSLVDAVTAFCREILLGAA